MIRTLSRGLLLSLVAVLGCGGDTSIIPVSGVVKLDGEPIAHAVVTFVPDANTKSNGGTGMTGADGRYQVMGPQGQKGLPAGGYKVTVSRWLRKDGTPPPPDVPPIESDAKETLPAMYSDSEKTTLNVTIEPGKSVDFDLKSGKK